MRKTCVHILDSRRGEPARKCKNLVGNGYEGYCSLHWHKERARRMERVGRYLYRNDINLFNHILKKAQSTSPFSPHNAPPP